ncbi:hypothetical protein ACW4TU_10335 [Streptomyces sp. QTS52]
MATPYLLFALHPALPATAVRAAVAPVGFGASMERQERLMTLVPDEPAVQAFELRSAGLLTLQGVSATSAVAVA